MIPHGTNPPRGPSDYSNYDLELSQYERAKEALSTIRDIFDGLANAKVTHSRKR